MRLRSTSIGAISNEYYNRLRHWGRSYRHMCGRPAPFSHSPLSPLQMFALLISEWVRGTIRKCVVCKVSGLGKRVEKKDLEFSPTARSFLRIHGYYPQGAINSFSITNGRNSRDNFLERNLWPSWLELNYHGYSVAALGSFRFSERDDRKELWGASSSPMHKEAVGVKSCGSEVFNTITVS